MKLHLILVVSTERYRAERETVNDVIASNDTIRTMTRPGNEMAVEILTKETETIVVVTMEMNEMVIIVTEIIETLVVAGGMKGENEIIVGAIMTILVVTGMIVPEMIIVEEIYPCNLRRK
jgi:hypothetical protein